MAVTNPIFGAVLAGGASRRMGRDKAGLMLGGRSLLDRARDLLSDAGAARVLTLGRDAPNGLPDPAPGGGPAQAVIGAAAWAREAGAARLLVLPVDMPGLTAPDLTDLLGACAGGLARFEAHPLPLTLDLTAVADLDPLDWRNAPLKSLPWPVVAELTPVGRQARLVNLNRPEDLEAFEIARR